MLSYLFPWLINPREGVHAMSNLETAPSIPVLDSAATLVSSREASGHVTIVLNICWMLWMVLLSRFRFAPGAPAGILFGSTGHSTPKAVPSRNDPSVWNDQTISNHLPNAECCGCNSTHCNNKWKLDQDGDSQSVFESKLPFNYCD